MKAKADGLISAPFLNLVEEALADGLSLEGVTTEMPITSAEEKAQRRLEVKARKYEEIDGGYVAFGGDPKGEKIIGKDTIKTSSRPDWLFDIYALTRTMNYEQIVADPKSSHDDGSKPSCDDGKKVDEDLRKENKCNDQEKEDNIKSTNNVNTVCSTVNDAGINEDNELPFDPNMPALEDVSTFNFSNHPLDQVIEDLQSTTQIRRISKNLEEHRGELTFFLGLQVKQKNDGIFISEDKYVAEILKKFRFTKVKTASTPMESQNPLLKDEDGEEVDAHMYRSVSGSLMYLISSRLDIVFIVYACARYQVNPKVSHLYAMKMIFRYLKGQPKLGLWYPNDYPFDKVAYTDSDYARASLDRKSTTKGCQFFGCRLISWQCKKQRVVANAITVAKYMAASSCCG
nr:uncharacterized mitochondrial protein AtMg00810-like [Tanacetum cinerariifolium]